MTTKPLIGLNADYRAARRDTPAFAYLCAGYFDCLIRVGAVPIIIPPLADEHDLRRVLDLLDGVVLVAAPTSTPAATASCSTARFVSWILGARILTAG